MRSNKRQRMNCYNMQRMRLASLLSFLLLLVFRTTQAQLAVVVKTETEEDRVRITYEIQDSLTSRLYNIKLWGRSDSASFPLSKLEGEFGENITVGTHEVVWDALAELERYSGSLLIEVQALPQFLFLGPKMDQTVKRGNPITFSWYGDNSTLDQLKIELYRYDEVLDTLGTVSQQGSYTWQVPKDIKASGGYRIRLIGTSKSGNLTAFSPQVRVVEKVPVLYKYIGLGTIVTGAGFVVVQLLRALPPIFGPNE